jgi:hypothetical protein
MSKSYVVPTFESFFDSSVLKMILDSSGTRLSWDWRCSLGDTIMEKLESFYIKLIELNNVLISKGAKGYFWIAASPIICELTETSVAFKPCPNRNKEEELSVGRLIGGVLAQGIPDVFYIGTINTNWRVYKAPFSEGKLLMGCNDCQQDCAHYGTMTIDNFRI